MLQPVKLNHTLLISLLAGLLAGPALAAENPDKVKMTSEPAGAPGVFQRFECGTYRGNQAENQWFKAKHRQLLQKVSPVPAVDFVHEDVWVVEDNGALLFSGLNVFDTDNQTVRFTPNGGGGYDVTSVTFNFRPLGANLGMGDDTNTSVGLGFTFDFFGTPWTSVQVNSNGIIGFGAIINPSGFYDDGDFFSSVPKIAAYFMDLNPAAAGAVYHNSHPSRETFTWNAVPEFGTANLNTLQLVLYNDDSFDITWDGITSTLASNGAPIFAGMHPGGSTPSLESISYSGDLPYVGGSGAGVFEDYLNITNPLVNEVALFQKFYQNFPDVYFQLNFFTNFIQTMGGFANERNISNDVTGIGLPIFDDSATYGSAGVLESRCNMNRLAVWPVDPTNRFFGSDNNFLTIMGQEAGHRWGAFMQFLDGGSPSFLLLGRSNAHWSYYADIDHSSLEGGNWELVSGNLYTCPTQVDFFSDIDEYTFGLRTPEEVTSTFYVSSPTNDLPANRSQGTPVMGATATGTPITVTIDDIIGAEGARTPTEPNENKDLRQAFILLVQNGDLPTMAELDKIVGFRTAWEDYFEKSCSGRITCNTSLTADLPVGVLKGEVRDIVTLDAVPDFLATSIEHDFDQFVTAGGRYTFRYMPDSLGAPDTCCVTIAVSAPGYLPDTVVVCIPYDSTVCQNIDLVAVATAIDDGITRLPVPATLYPAYPNPFNPQTTLRFLMPEAGHARLVIYDARGQLIRTLVDGRKIVGEHDAVWNGRDRNGVAVGSGVYFARFEAADRVQTQKLLLLK